jgi:predicted permease
MKFSFWKHRQRDQELNEEIQAHLTLGTREEMELGQWRKGAELNARRKFGNETLVRETTRDMWGWRWITDLFQDVRYGLRMLRKNPGFAAVAVLSIALGIGANTAIFSIIYALLLRSLPVPNPQSLVQATTVINGAPSDSFSYPVICALAERKDIFTALGGYSDDSFVVGPPDEPVQTPGAWVSGEFYQALELVPSAGRLLSPEDDEPGAQLVAVISDGYWERNFHREPRTVGSTLVIGGHSVTIVGVSPRGFTGPNVGKIADVTMAYQAVPQIYPSRRDPLGTDNLFSRILARPSFGLSMEQARARLKVIWPLMASVSVTPQTPANRRQAMLGSSLDLVPGGFGWTPLRNQYRRPLYVLMSISVLVLLVACANVANLLLVRATARQREIAMRLAIGASRGRLIRQLLAESMLLAAAGAASGLVLARFGSQLLIRLVASGPQPIPLDVSVNGTVLSFTIGIAMLTGLLFGLAPAFHATIGGPGFALTSSERTSAGSRGRLAPALVSAQVALSLLLLIGAGLFVGTMRNLESIDPGFRHQGVLVLNLDGRRALRISAQSSSENDSRIARFYRDSLETISSLRGVASVSVSNLSPVSNGVSSQPTVVRGQLSGEDVPFFAVSPLYFATLHIPLNSGRDFTFQDDPSTQPVVIVNEEFVRRYIPDGYPLGQRVSAADPKSYQNMEIVGVVANSISYSLREHARPTVFIPFFQQLPGRMGFGNFEIQVNGSLSTVSNEVVQVMRPRTPGMPLVVRSFTAQVEDSFRREILMAKLAGFFGVLSLILAAVGLYGLLAYMVTRRTSEIGIRIALGAQRGEVVWMILGGAVRLVAIGIALGLPVAWWASRLISGMLYGMSATDPLTIVVSVAVLAATALAAGFIPAHRASRVDPIVALRYE